MNSNDGALDFEVLMNNDKFKATLDESVRRVQGLSKTTVNEGKKMDGAFKQIGEVVSGLIGPVSAMAAAYKLQELATQAYEFERAFGMAMREVQTISKAVQEDFEGISEAIVNMSANGPEGAEKLAKAYYQIVSAGYDGAAGLNLLDIASKAATAGVTDTLIAADGLTTVLNAFGLSADKAENVADVMFKTVERGKTTFGELASSIAQVAPLAAANNISFEEIFAALQTITKQGTPTAQAMTQIRSSIINMNNVLGDGWSKTMTYQDGLNKIALQAGGSQTALKALIPDVEAISGVLALTGDKAKGAAEDLEATAVAAGSMQKAYGAMMLEADNKWSMVRNKWTREMRTLGKAMKEGSSMFADALNDMLSNEQTDIIDPGAKKIVDDTATSIASLVTKEEKLAFIIAKINELQAKRVKDLNPAASTLEKQQPGVLTRGLETLNAGLGLGTGFTPGRVKQVELQMYNKEIAITQKAEKELFKLYTDTAAAKDQKANTTAEKAARTLKDINAEIKAAKELQETSTSRAQFDNAQTTINRLETEKAAIVSVKSKAEVEAIRSTIEASKDYIAIQDQIIAKIKELHEANRAGNTSNGLLLNENIRALEKQRDLLVTGGEKINPLGATVATKMPISQLKPMKQLTDEQYKQLQAASKQADLEEGIPDKLQKEANLRQDLAFAASELGQILAANGMISQEAASAISDTMGAIASGDPLQMAAQAISMIASMFPNQAEEFQNRIDKINASLREQQRLIELAGRFGGEETARAAELKDLQRLKAEQEAQLAKAEKKRDNKVFKIGPVYKGYVRDVNELTAAIVETNNAIDDAEIDLQDFLTGGITENTLADAIARGFEEGKTAVDDFADYMSEVFRDASLEILKTDLLNDPEMVALKKYIDNSWANDGIIDAKEKEEIDRRTAYLAEKHRYRWDSMESVTGTLGDDGAPDNSMQGRISAAITEDTGTELVGLWNRTSMDTRSIRDYTKLGLDRLVGIESNTYNTVAELQKAVIRLDQIVTNTKNSGSRV